MSVHFETYDAYEPHDKFTLLFNTYGRALKRKAYRILKDDGWAEDAVQATFVKVLHHMDKIADPFSDQTKSYLSTILIHTCYSMFKKNHKYFLMDDYTMQIDYGIKLAHTENPAEGVICEELLNDVRKLPEIYASLLIMHARYHYSFNEIGEMLELKPATVRKRIQRGREMLEAMKVKDDYKE